MPKKQNNALIPSIVRKAVFKHVRISPRASRLRTRASKSGKIRYAHIHGSDNASARNGREHSNMLKDAEIMQGAQTA